MNNKPPQDRLDEVATTAAARDYMRQRFAKIRAGEIEPCHGTSEGIMAGCRCERCEEHRRRRRAGTTPRVLTDDERAALIGESDLMRWAALASELCLSGVRPEDIAAAARIPYGTQDLGAHPGDDDAG